VASRPWRQAFVNRYAYININAGRYFHCHVNDCAYRHGHNNVTHCHGNDGTNGHGDNSTTRRHGNGDANCHGDNSTTHRHSNGYANCHSNGYANYHSDNGITYTPGDDVTYSHGDKRYGNGRADHTADRRTHCLAHHDNRGRGHSSDQSDLGRLCRDRRRRHVHQCGRELDRAAGGLQRRGDPVQLRGRPRR
jgi:hypothetical protein